jgi:hypothetical protein
LRRPLIALRPRPVLDDPRAQPLADEAQDPLVRDPVLKEPPQPAMIKAGEVVADVRVEHPVHLPPQDPGGERIQRVMRAAPWPEPVGEAQEVRLVNGAQHLDDGPLEDLVLQRGNAERPQPPVRLRDVRPPRRPRPVAPAMDPTVEVDEVFLKVLPVGPPRHPVHPRPSPRAQRPVGRPQAIQVDVVQERREPHILVLLHRSAHTVQRTWRALPGSVSGARIAGRVPLGRPPSLHRLRDRSHGVVRQLRRYYRAV